MKRRIIRKISVSPDFVFPENFPVELACVCISFLPNLRIFHYFILLRKYQGKREKEYIFRVASKWYGAPIQLYGKYLYEYTCQKCGKFQYGKRCKHNDLSVFQVTQLWNGRDFSSDVLNNEAENFPGNAEEFMEHLLEEYGGWTGFLEHRAFVEKCFRQEIILCTIVFSPFVFLFFWFSPAIYFFSKNKTPHININHILGIVYCYFSCYFLYKIHEYIFFTYLWV